MTTTAATSNAGKGDAEQPYLDLSDAMVPTSWDLSVRLNPFKQLWRFAMFSLRLMRMVLAGHH